MPESFKTEKYEDRPSNKLGVMDYFTKQAVWTLVPFIGFGVGLAARKITKIPMLEQPSSPANFFLGKENRKTLREMADNSGKYVMRNGEAWGLGLGGFLAAYRLWGNNTKQQLEIDQLTTDITALRAMESPNAYLQRENLASVNIR